MLTTIASHLQKKLPFVLYRKPNEIKAKAILQNTEELHTVTDFSESGFVFAPFDTKDEVVLISSDQLLDLDLPKVKLKTQGNLEAKINEAEHQSHTALVAKGVKLIQHSEIEKIVLSRNEMVSTNADPISLFQQLEATYKTAFVYLWHHPEVGTWLGATPETLLKAKGNTITTMSLAGTRKFLGDEKVSWNQKEIDEQLIVTDYIVNLLKTKTTNLSVSEATTHRAGSLVHLCAMISGRISSDTNIGDIITTLHPTPAICGFPTAMAKEFILKEEGYNRSFYTGYLGELNIKEETSRNRNRKNQENSAYRVVRSTSDLYVNLRCMQLIANTAVLYIGGGIVKDSDPESEWKETVAKSQIMKRVL